MSTRRIPLANAPNAANSPFRPLAGATSKRPRSQIYAQEDALSEQQPPVKKQAIEVDRSALRTPQRQTGRPADGQVFNKRPSTSQSTAFGRRLLAAKEREAQERPEGQGKTTNETLDNIRQWQKHYRGAFPSFVFYFESIPDEIRLKCSRQITVLGAREEKFFSRNVTHVVTTRTIPVENDSRSPTESTTPLRPIASQNPNQPRTINPSLLDRTPESQSQGQQFSAKSKFNFETSLSRRVQTQGTQDAEPRKQQAGISDILCRAREMGIKIWQLEKLQRIMTTIFDPVIESQSQHGHNTRKNTANSYNTAKVAEIDLSHMIRNEQLNGPSDRDSTVVTNELVLFKGPHLYVRDMDEKTKPMLIREYTKVPRKEEGEWPQLRCVSQGKCPFVEEGALSKRELEREKVREQESLARAKGGHQKDPRTQVTLSFDTPKTEAYLNATGKRPLAEVKNAPNRMAPNLQGTTRTSGLQPSVMSIKGRSPLKESKHLFTGATPKLYGGEPAASGLQPSNITSAIRSQVISSTAAAPGTKAGISKEVHELKRKVLERNSGSVLNTIPTAPRIVELTGSARAERSIPQIRQANRKAQEKLSLIDEDFTPSEEEENTQKLDELRRSTVATSKKMEKKNLKPGYCENCRDKFDDFDEHINERKHRKFAVTQSNWKELDDLLAHLSRRLKDDELDEP